MTLIHVIIVVVLMINMDHFMIKYPLLWAKKMLIVLVIVAVLIEKYMVF
jgi:hypothetical protein